MPKAERPRSELSRGGVSSVRYRSFQPSVILAEVAELRRVGFPIVAVKRFDIHRFRGWLQAARVDVDAVGI